MFLRTQGDPVPTQAQVFEVADALLAEGHRPSRRKINERLPGSPRVILEHLDAWRNERLYKPELDLSDLPERLQEQLAAFAKNAWRTAQVQAAAAWRRERVSSEEIRRDEAEDREHLLGLLEEARTKSDGLEAQLAMAEAEAERLRASLETSEDQGRRLRSEAFWDRLMQEVREILPSEGGMTPEEVLPVLEPWTKRGAALAKQKLTSTTLKAKMSDRSYWGRYMTALPDGRFVRRAGKMLTLHSR